MEFGWSPEQERVRDEVVQFSRRELTGTAGASGGAAEASTEPRFDRSRWQRAAAFGIQGSFIPRKWGGQGRDVLTTILVMESVGRGCPDNGFTLGLNGHMWAVEEPILRFGSDEQRMRFLPGLAGGTWIGAHGMTEIESGSDAFSLTTRAERDGDTYVLNGRKAYIGLAPVCDLALIFANTDPGVGQWGVSAFVVEAGTTGFSTPPPQEKMGLAGAPLGEIRLENCRVPAANRLGPEGAGVSIFNHSMEWERSFIFASHVGAMARQLDRSVERARERRQFGRSIGSFQSVSNRIADMKLRLETARLLLYRAAWLKQNDRPCPLDAALTKLHLSESFVSSSLDAVRIHGATGYLREYGVERDLRDATGGILYSGTSDIQRQLIARLLGL